MRLITYEIHHDRSIDAVIELRRWWFPWSWKRYEVWAPNGNSISWRFVHNARWLCQFDASDSRDHRLNAMIQHAELVRERIDNVIRLEAVEKARRTKECK